MAESTPKRPESLPRYIVFAVPVSIRDTIPAPKTLAERLQAELNHPSRQSHRFVFQERITVTRTDQYGEATSDHLLVTMEKK